jgi:adenine-specific DNA-methyltransferase
MIDQNLNKLNLPSSHLVNANLEKLAALFPHCITETAEGRTVDLDMLKQELGHAVVEGPKERYRLEWPGKREAVAAANLPTTKTLLPAPGESVDFDNTKNLYIEGDNLDVLKILQENYSGQIKLIYLDPPYNTGKNFVYKDKFADNTETEGRYHANWLNMMYPRLKLARNLLKEDGVIFISIDDYEVHNMRKLCDEIIGEDNFITTLIWNKQHSQQQGLFKKYHEYVLLYARNSKAHTNIPGGEGIIKAGALKKISRLNPASEFTFPAGVRFDAPDGTVLTGTYGDSEKVTVVNGRLIAENGKTKEAVTLSAGWTQKDQMTQFFQGQEVLDTKGQKVIDFYFNSTGKLKSLKERSTITPSTFLPKYGMVSEQSEHIANLFGKPVFDNPKPVEMLKDFINWFCNDEDTVLDFFSGSGTLAESVFVADKNVHFILVQLPQVLDHSSDLAKNAMELGYTNICEIGKERIRRAAKKIRSATGADRDYGFRVYRLTPTIEN